MAASKKFSYHKPSPAGVAAIEKIRQGCSDLEQIILDNTTPSREQSLALTNLEQVSMWANKGIVINDPESTIAS